MVARIAKKACQESSSKSDLLIANVTNKNGGAPRERRRRRAEKRLSKRVFLESLLLLYSLMVSSTFKSKPKGGRDETDSPKTPF